MPPPPHARRHQGRPNPVPGPPLPVRTTGRQAAPATALAEAPTQVIPKLVDKPAEPAATENALADLDTEVGLRADQSDTAQSDADLAEADDTGGRLAPAADGPLRKSVRTLGELLVTAGLVMLLFVVYEVYVTDWMSAGKQDEATSALDNEWATVDNDNGQERTAHYNLADGQGFAKLYIPGFGTDYQFTIVEGTTDRDLEIGPGHYKGTALPGEPGNFAVAGHRVGKGSPFNDLDMLNSCDAVVIETRSDWFVYRVLPKADEEADWASGKGSTDPRCAQVKPLKDASAPNGGPYARTVGQEIVSPSQGEVIEPVPYYSGQLPAGQQVSLLTLTTCHPRFSNRQRLIIHGVLVKQWQKDPAKPNELPQELKEQ